MKKNEKRILGLKKVADEYANAGLSWHKNCKFSLDMINRISEGKSLTRSQRAWIDALIIEPLPEPKNPELYNRLISAATVYGVSPEKSMTMNDLAKSAFVWELSEKQIKFANSLIEYSENLKVSGPYEPDEKTIARLKLVSSMAASRNEWWWSNHPGVRRSMQLVKHYLKSLDIDPSQHVVIEEYHVNRVFKSFKTRIDQFLNPRWNVGDQAWVKVGGEWKLTTIWSGPKLLNGDQYHNCMVGNVFMDIHLKNIKSQRR
jgi:hypothetical protein